MSLPDYQPTYKQISTDILEELDLQGEVFVRTNELLNYFNQAIENTEGVIHALCEDYYKTEAWLRVTANNPFADLPPDIYGQKIRGIFYVNSTQKYEVKYIRRPKDTLYMNENPANWYMYDLINKTGIGTKIKIYPTPDYSDPVPTDLDPDPEASMKIFYLRRAVLFTGDPDQRLDIPEYSAVIKQYVRWMCYAKEVHPFAQNAKEVLDEMKIEMRETLADRQPNEDTLIQPDVELYTDQDNYFLGNGAL